MKKVLLIILTLFVGFTLTSCKEKLENPYFENPKTESWEETEDLFVSYMFKVKSHYETYTKHGDLRPDMSNYIEYQEPSYLTKEVLVRDDFSNYALSNDLDYMSKPNLYNLYYSIEDIVYLIKDYCSDMKEGNTCSNGTSEIRFYRDVWNLNIQYTENKNTTGQTVYDLYFTRNTDNLVTLDAKIKIYQDPQAEVYKYQTISWIEGVSETNEEITRSGDELSIETSTYIKTTYDIKRDIYTYFEQNSDFEISGYYNPVYSFYQEIKWHYEDKNFYDYNFTQYYDSVVVYKYNETEDSLFTNLMQFQNWNQIKQIDNRYYLFLNDQQVIEQAVDIVDDFKSEYPYVHFTESLLDGSSYFDDVQNLSIGLTYSTLMAGRTEFILTYQNFREYTTDNRTLEENFNFIIEQF